MKTAFFAILILFFVPVLCHGQYSYPRQNKVYINAKFLGEGMAKVTLAHPHSYLSKDHMNLPFNDRQFANHLMGVYVGFSSGHEEALTQWMLAQPDNSINPLGLYGKSLDLNQGNVWNAVLCIHEVLRNHARWFDKQRYWGKNISETEAQTLLNKLVDIRGDLEERGGKFKGDHGGSWYRIWGIMLDRFRSPTVLELFNTELSKKRRFFITTKERLKNFGSRWVTANVAEWIKPFIGWPEKDWRKAEINRMGAMAANELLKALQKETPPLPDHSLDDLFGTSGCRYLLDEVKMSSGLGLSSP